MPSLTTTVPGSPSPQNALEDSPDPVDPNSLRRSEGFVASIVHGSAAALFRKQRREAPTAFGASYRQQMWRRPSVPVRRRETLPKPHLRDLEPATDRSLIGEPGKVFRHIALTWYTVRGGTDANVLRGELLKWTERRSLQPKKRWGRWRKTWRSPALRCGPLPWSFADSQS